MSEYTSALYEVKLKSIIISKGSSEKAEKSLKEYRKANLDEKQQRILRSKTIAIRPFANFNLDRRSRLKIKIKQEISMPIAVS
jgi:hypothetical protein